MLNISLKFLGLTSLVIILSIWLGYLNPIEKIKIKKALYNDVEIPSNGKPNIVINSLYDLKDILPL